MKLNATENEQVVLNDQTQKIQNQQPAASNNNNNNQ